MVCLEGMSSTFSKEEKFRITRHLQSYITEHKQNRIEEVLSSRTRHITIVLEDIFKPHNASAVIRTAECLGIQDIHVVQNTNPYTVNPYVLRGALKWMNLYQYGDGNGMHSPECISHLRKQGYQILATSVDPTAVPVNEINVDQKSAIVFGTEHSGISEYIRDEADQLITIPMVGFTDSFNISVSAGIILDQMLLKLKESNLDWGLSAEEKDELRFEWYRNIPPHADEIIKNFLKQDTQP